MRLLSNKWTALSLGILLSQSTWAQDSFQNNILWKDTQGLKKAESCTLTTYDQSPFAITSNKTTGNTAPIVMRLTDSRTIKNIPARSLLIVTNAHEHNHIRAVKIVGLPQNKKIKNSVSHSEEGHVFETQLKAVDDYVIQLLDNDENKKIKSTFFKVAGTFWQLAMQNQKYLGLSCADKKTYNKELYLFNVFTKDGDQAIAQVAVSIDNTEIFKNITVYSADEIETLTSKDASEDDALEVSEKNASSVQTIQTTHSIYKTRQPKIIPKTMITVKTEISKTGKVTAKEVAKVFVRAALDPVAAAKEMAKVLAESITGISRENSSGTGTIIDYLICTKDSGLAIRNEKSELLFEADRFEAVQIVQSWNGNNDKIRTKVKFPNRKNQVGYAASEFVKLKSACEPYQERKKQKDDADENENISKGGSLDSAKCCVFPTEIRPTHSYKEGMRKFRARRSGGKRAHAACDLYQKISAPAVAVTTGKIVRNMYFFYQGTFALEVAHTGGYVARYGELKGKKAPNIAAENRVTPGQTLGFIGKVNSGCCKPMLHFELYSGKVKGALSHFSNRPFQRRSDLINPTDYLIRWEQKQFGESY